MKKRFAGYTFTDLAILVAIFGILAAFAYPRYSALRSETKKALVRSLGTNVQVSAQVAHLLWIVQDEPTTIDYNNQTITMRNGYPDESSIDDSLATFSGFQFLNDVTANFRKIDASAPETCMVSYAGAAMGSSPIIDILTSGC